MKTAKHNNTNKRVNQEKQREKRDRDLVCVRLQAAGESLDATHITLVTARNLHLLPSQKIHNQRNIGAVILPTLVSFLPREGQPAV